MVLLQKGHAMGKKGFTILIVDDTKVIQDVLTGILKKCGRITTVLNARTIEEAEALFAANPSVDLIVMDACVPGGEINTEPLVRKIRQTYKGPIIGSSTSLHFQDRLVEAGCTTKCEKVELPQTIYELLGIK